MFEILVAGSIAAMATGFAWAAARLIGPAGTRRHRAVLLVSFVSLFTLGSAVLMPRARAWKRDREVETLLHDEPLFAAVIGEEPALRGPLREALLDSLRDGERSEAVAAGLRLLSPRLWRFVPQASDAAAVALGRALVATLSDLQARDPQQCYRFLFPAVAGPPGASGTPRDDFLLSALRAVALSARGGSAEPLDRAAAGKSLDAAFERLRKRHGDDVDVLRRSQAPGVDRARVCAMTIALYSELLSLPPEAAGQSLRHALGPAEPSAPGR
ncbi:MAG TPA: hypothetical protein VMT70_20495 [Vicinamibacteria bacterium]|nr:hypothetical protein [Vicinamibacteria bacterium]